MLEQQEIFCNSASTIIACLSTMFSFCEYLIQNTTFSMTLHVPFTNDTSVRPTGPLIWKIEHSNWFPERAEIYNHGRSQTENRKIHTTIHSVKYFQGHSRLLKRNSNSTLKLFLKWAKQAGWLNDVISDVMQVSISRILCRSVPRNSLKGPEVPEISF